MQTLTPELEAILKSKFQAAASGFSGRMEVDGTSYRCAQISIDKSLRMQADQATVVLLNEDLGLGWGPDSLFPTNSRITIYQWFGDVANEILTFTGLIDKVADHRDEITLTLTCRDMMALLIDQTFSASAPQSSDESGAVRTAANGVYLSMEIADILDDILDRAGWPDADRDITPTSFVLDEFVVDDGATWADTIIGDDRLTGLTGYDAWADELGVFHFAPTPASDIVTVDIDPVYAWRSGIDLVSLDDATDQYDLKTRVKVRGPLTTLKDAWTKLWQTSKFNKPVGLWYAPGEPTILRVLDRGTKRLYKLRQSDRVVLSSVYLGGVVPYPLGLSGDPSDSTIYWVLNAPWVFTGSTSGNSVKKIRKSDNHVLATYAIPNGRWSAVKVSAAYLWLTNLDTDRFYKRSKTDASAIANYQHTVSAVTQANPSGLMVDGTTLHLFWANGGTTARFLVCDESAPTTITQIVKTAGTTLHGGEMDTTTHTECFGDSDSLGLVAKFTLVSPVTHDVSTEIIDSDLEDELGELAGTEDRVHDAHSGDPAHSWEARRATLDLSVISSLAQASDTARAWLDGMARRRRVVDAGIVGNPALQKTDLVRVEDPVTGISQNFIIDTYRTQMSADGTYLGTVALVRGGAANDDITEDQPPVVDLTDLSEGGWTQASRPNAVYLNGHTYLGWMNGSSGNVEVGDYDHLTGTTTTFVLHAALEVDIHDAPAFLIRASDQRLMAFYSKHDGSTVYMRISTNPLDVTAWDAEVSLHSQLGGSGDYTYMQPLQLDNGTIFLFYRDFIGGSGTGKVAYSTSTDDGATWAAQTILFSRTGHWIYSWVIADGNRIDIALTDGAPALEANVATWHAYYSGGSWHQTDGSALGSPPFLPSATTQAFAPSSGDSAWPWSITYDTLGHPVILEQVIYSTARNSIRRVAWSGSAWAAHQIDEVDIDPASAGLVAWEPAAGFSPGAVLDLDNSLIAYLCVLVSGVFEIVKYTSADGVTWTSTAVTSGSTDDIRYPFSPPGAGFDVLFLEGTFTSYLVNDLQVKGA